MASQPTPTTTTSTDPEAMAALRKLLFSATDCNPSQGDTVIDAALALVERLNDQTEAIRDLQAQVEVLEATADRSERSKRAKHEAIVNAAENKFRSNQAGPAGVELTFNEVMAAAGVSRRYSYTLMEEMGAAYDWASYSSEPKCRLKVQQANRDWAELIASVHKNVSEE